MKKTIKKLMAALLAVALLCAMAVPAFAENQDISNHSFSAYQIFKGNVKDSTLSNVEWGAGIDHEALLSKLTNDTSLSSYFEGITTASPAAQVAEKMSGWSETDVKTTAFAKAVSECLASDATYTSTRSNSIHFKEAGYYLIKDTTVITPGQNNVANISLLNVTAADSTVTVKSKVEKPTVTKLVEDNDDGDGAATGDNNGFGSSADHAIGEVFRFKLTAKVPASNNNAYDFYKSYKVNFSDTMSEGLTFDGIESVTIQSGSDTKTLSISDYTCTPHSDVNGASGSGFELTISNVKTLVTNLNSGAEITVLYKAHLNEKAAVNDASGNTTNINKVSLQYSNNPNAETSFDTTPYETVYVFTYQLNNTKYKNSVADENKLSGAGFRLYSDKECTTEIKLKKNDGGTYSRDFSTNAVGVEMKSAADGTFNVKGLDAGTYYLKETSTPDGFNTCGPTTITVSATHTGNHVTLSETSNLSNNIINMQGATLPSTGGMGTTLFYVIGGGLMVVAVVLLVTKKRMENK